MTVKKLEHPCVKKRYLIYQHNISFLYSLSNDINNNNYLTDKFSARIKTKFNLCKRARHMQVFE
jgi:hypothetical protein